MAIIKSSAKASRRADKRRKNNDKVRDALKLSEKKLKRALRDKETDGIKELLNELKKYYDKAARKNILHTNRAAKKKSKWEKKVNNLLEG